MLIILAPKHSTRLKSNPKFQHTNNQLITDANKLNIAGTYVVQLASAIKKVHEKGQAVRMLDVTEVPGTAIIGNGVF